ncbi:signal peptidase I [Porcipelethomonas sp.]|uniref:signal peptidase I n=1 Tax=Porcipelethomonas sp. TaxID=2981675 RepID=UPI003EFB1329
MEMKNMSKESREAEIDRILAETARNPYKKIKPAAPVKRPEVPKRPEMPKNPDVPKTPVQSAPDKKDDLEKTVLMQMPSEEERERAEKAKASAAEKIRKIKEEKHRAMTARRTEKAESEETVPVSDDYTDNFLPEPEDEQITESRSMIKNRQVIFSILDICEGIVIAVFIITLVFTYIFRSAVVSGNSMSPTLKDGDRLLAFVPGSPSYGDIVVINDTKANLIDPDGSVTQKDGLDCKIVKRVIAVGGDTIDFDFDNGIVYVNGKALEESYINEPTTRDEQAFDYPLTIPEGYYFVMGDNRNISKDSRHEDIGLVSEDDIAGKVLLRVYPFENAGSVK